MNRCTHINPDVPRHIRCLLVSGHAGPCQHHNLTGTAEVTRTMNSEHDPMVHRPEHYNLNDMGIEAIDAIRAALGDEGFRAYCRGSIIKYAWRAENKGNPKQDLAKAAWYARLAAGDDPRNVPMFSEASSVPTSLENIGIRRRRDQHDHARDEEMKR